MDIGLKYVNQEASKWTVTRAIANVLHSEDFWPRKAGERLINFQVTLNDSPAGGVRNDGTGTLTLPTFKVGERFLAWVRDHPIKIEKKKVAFFKRHRPPQEYVARTLDKTPYIDPDIDEEHAEKLWDLQDRLRVETVQFGVFYRSTYPSGQLPPRSFSVEWEIQTTGWLSFEYDYRLMRITLGDSTIQNEGSIIAISFANIQKIAVGYDGPPYICFDLIMPAVLEEIEFHRAHTGDKVVDNRRWRVSSLDSVHKEVAPYAHHVRILLFPEYEDPIEKFITMCRKAGVSSKSLIFKLDHRNPMYASKQRFFDMKRVYLLRRQISTLPFHVAFQLEALLHNHLLNTEELEKLIPTIEKLNMLHPEQEGVYTGGLLKHFCETLKDPKRSQRESPMECLQRVKERVKLLRSRKSSKGHFSCYHVTITPTRMLLEGPYATDSNRVIRLYPGHEHEFLRVDFSDEDRLHYKWEREVDTSSVLKERVEVILKEGFDLGGRHFEFLAYSSSALREHSVWFVHPFLHKTAQGTVKVTADSIRRAQGDFEGTKLLRQPSKYAARLAQAFTATVPSVEIHREEWEKVEDLGSEPYLFTDGVGTISKALGDRIWAKLCEQRGRENSIQPSAYQIRFLGFKGVVGVDLQLDGNPNGILMRLRDSMHKFDKKSDIAILEIAEAFEYPKPVYLNRPLVMFLEDLGVREETFIDLKDAAVLEAHTIDDSISHFRDALDARGHGNIYRLTSLLKQFEAADLELHTKRAPGIDTPFLHELRQVAMLSVLRDIKFNARIAIPQSYMLVGVADEGPTYQKAGYENVYTLPEGHIYACIQRPEDPEPTWISGSCAIFRNPIAHPGDVQRVRAIGKPPKDKLCLFAHMKNVVVLPSVGSRSLASCLAGGDLDGDQFAVVNYSPLLPSSHENPASYAPNPDKPTTWELKNRDATINDVCDFIVQYIQSDVLGLLSDRLLVIADQSKEGVRDADCLYISELCSQAVDYPKQGIPVDLDEPPGLPRPLIRYKPDWQAAEVVSPLKTDYYESARVLGKMYRSISLQEKPTVSSNFARNQNTLTDPISLAYRSRVSFYIGLDGVEYVGESPELTTLFLQYVEELNYICSIHTVSSAPGARLRESEVVVGTILAPCTQKRLRNDRIHRMRLHAGTLVDDVRQEIFDQTKEVPATREDLVAVLKRAWKAWELSLNRGDEFGANSFGLIALETMLRLLDSLADCDGEELIYPTQ